MLTPQSKDRKLPQHDADDPTVPDHDPTVPEVRMHVALGAAFLVLCVHYLQVAVSREEIPDASAASAAPPRSELVSVHWCLSSSRVRDDFQAT
jgi:hypothetical protein